MADEGRKAYEVYNLDRHPPEFTSDDPVEVVHWMRSHPEKDKKIFIVHPTFGGFHRDRMISYDFISTHQMAVAEDIVNKAFEAGKPEGLAQELNDLFFGR